jgi:hypothetical protein
VETEQTKAFSKRFNYLLNKYQLERADDADIYEGDISAWEEDHINAFNKELDLLINKYGEFIKEHITHAEISTAEDTTDSSVDNEEEVGDDEAEKLLRKANRMEEQALKGKAEAFEKLNELKGNGNTEE